MEKYFCASKIQCIEIIPCCDIIRGGDFGVWLRLMREGVSWVGFVLSPKVPQRDFWPPVAVRRQGLWATRWIWCALILKASRMWHINVCFAWASGLWYFLEAPKWNNTKPPSACSGLHPCLCTCSINCYFKVMTPQYLRSLRGCQVYAFLKALITTAVLDWA